jgi:predicted TPR repeat methyltransferase
MDLSKEAADIFNKLADSYQEKFMDVSLYTETLDLFCDRIKKTNPEILELACGPGNITKYLLNRRSDLKITGTDLAPNMIRLAKINNPGAEFYVMDCREIIRLNKKYDGIMCGFCLPYLSKAEAIILIKDAAGLLNPGGLIYISTMEDNNSNSGYRKGSTGDEIFMNYHEESYLCAALEENGFKVIKPDRKTYIHNNVQTTDLILIAEKK